MSHDFDLTGVAPRAAKVIGGFYRDVFAAGDFRLGSVHVTGSAVTPDFRPGVSDVNSIAVLEEMDFAFLDAVAGLGKKYGKRGVRAPLVMTPGYIRVSLDSFPIEFMDAKLIHKTILGADVLASLEIKRADLRLACERELKAGLLSLRQGYLQSLGSDRRLGDVLAAALSGMIALFRAVIHLKGTPPPVPKVEVLKVLDDVTEMDLSPFSRVLEARREGKALKEGAPAAFKAVYDGLEELAEELDALET